MRIVFVRHGHPNYKDDCLTELGHLHAEAAAKRLADEPFGAIYSSTCGRARETAEHIAAPHGLDVTSYDFMREIHWGSKSKDIFMDGNPWNLVDYMVKEGQTLMSPTWRGEFPFAEDDVYLSSYDTVSAGIDGWLEELGFTREGEYYRVGTVKHETVAMVSHGGASQVALAHMFNLPVPFVCRAICPNFTAITVVTLNGAEGELISPRFEIMNDARHIRDLEANTYFGN